MAAKKGSTGRRYSEAERKQILAFVKSQGRGGFVRAKEKFGVSYVALKRWMGPNAKPGKRGLPKKATEAKPTKIKGLKGILGLVCRTETNLAAIKTRLANLS